MSDVGAEGRLFKNLVTLPELVAILPGFSRRSVYRWVKAGMPHEKIRGRLLFDPEEVALWMKRTSGCPEQERLDAKWAGAIKTYHGGRS